MKFNVYVPPINGQSTLEVQIYVKEAIGQWCGRFPVGHPIRAVLYSQDKVTVSPALLGESHTRQSVMDAIDSIGKPRLRFNPKPRLRFNFSTETSDGGDGTIITKPKLRTKPIETDGKEVDPGRLESQRPKPKRGKRWNTERLTKFRKTMNEKAAKRAAISKIRAEAAEKAKKAGKKAVGTKVKAKVAPAKSSKKKAPLKATITYLLSPTKKGVTKGELAVNFQSTKAKATPEQIAALKKHFQPEVKATTIKPLAENGRARDSTPQPTPKVVPFLNGEAKKEAAKKAPKKVAKKTPRKAAKKKATSKK